MELKQFLKDLAHERREAFAASAGTTWGHLKNVAFSGKLCGVALAVQIERESGMLVGRRELRPDDWWMIWPELVTDKHPLPVKCESAEGRA